MDLSSASAIVTGGASGLGLASARRLAARGAHVVLLDLPGSAGAAMADAIGGKTSFAAADITDAEAVAAAVDTARGQAPLRAVVHCAGLGGAVRVLERDGSPGRWSCLRACCGST